MSISEEITSGSLELAVYHGLESGVVSPGVNNSMEDLPLAQALPIGGTSADDQGQDQAQLHSWLQRLPAEVQASTKDAAFVQVCRAPPQ